MTIVTNTRPTILQRPNGKNVLPGESFTPEAKELENPGMKIFIEAGFLLVDGVGSITPEAQVPAGVTKGRVIRERGNASVVAQPPPSASDRIALVQIADEESLLKLWENESDPEVIQAMNARAAFLAKDAVSKSEPSNR